MGRFRLARFLRVTVRHLSVSQPALQAPARRYLVIRCLLVRLSPSPIRRTYHKQHRLAVYAANLVVTCDLRLLLRVH
jgi:hypothetical protein